MYKVIRKVDNKVLGIENNEFNAHDLIFIDLENRGLGHLEDDKLDQAINEYEIVEIEQ